LSLFIWAPFSGTNDNNIGQSICSRRRSWSAADHRPITCYLLSLWCN